MVLLHPLPFLEIYVVTDPALVHQILSADAKKYSRSSVGELMLSRSFGRSILTAEGEKQAQILTAEGAKQAAVLTAEGAQQAAVLDAEGERQAAILRAQGEAKAIDTVFTAIHAGKPNRELLSYEYLQMLPQLAEGDSNKVFVVPSEFAEAFGGIGEALSRRLGQDKPES